MAWILAVVLAAITVATAYFVGAKVWWFPPPISELARHYDEHFVFTLALCGFFFILGQALLAYVVVAGWRRKRDLSLKWVAVVMGVMVLLDISLSRGASQIWKQQHMTPTPAGALRIEVTGQQFAWNVRYAGPDGRFGRTDPKLVNDSGGNPLGLDPKDPAAADDVVRATIVAPVNWPVEIQLRSKDVLHSLFVRELRIKQDAVPGMVIPVRFTAEKTGRYEVCCAELCGLGHHRMRSYLDVVEPAEFEKRLRE